jgi:hypothetical protein
MDEIEVTARSLACEWTLGNIAQPRVGMLDRIAKDLIPVLRAQHEKGRQEAMAQAKARLTWGKVWGWLEDFGPLWKLLLLLGIGFAFVYEVYKQEHSHVHCVCTDDRTWVLDGR